MLLTLPDETLVHVFSYATRPVLHALCYVNKRCSNLAQPLLFDTFSEQNLHHFLMMLVRKPHLAKAVRQFCVSEWQTIHELDEHDCDSLVASEEDLQLLESVTLGLDLPEKFKTRMISNLKVYLEDVELALVMALCTNLEVLRFSASPFCVANSHFMALTSLIAQSQLTTTDDLRPRTWKPGGSSHILSHLRELVVYHYDTEFSTNLADFHPIMCAPNLVSVSGGSLGYHMSEEVNSRITYPSIRSVEIQQADFDTEAIQQLLSSCPRLEAFTLEWGSALVTYAEVRWNEIGDVFRRHGHALQTIRIDTEDYEGDWSISLLPLGSLASLINLIHLDVPATALFGVDEDSDESNDLNVDYPSLLDILPRSLEVLKLRDCKEDNEVFEDDLSNLMISACFPNLRVICMYGSNNKHYERLSSNPAQGWGVGRHENGYRWERLK